MSLVPTEDVKVGSKLCIETDLGNIAVVQIDKATLDGSGQLEQLASSFLVWSA